MAGKSSGGQTRHGRPGAPAGRPRTWGRSASTWDDSFKRTAYGYPSASARLAMQANSSRRARSRVVGSKLTHNATLGYISRGTARRRGLDDPGWTRYVPFAIAALLLVGLLAGIGYASHGENLGTFMGAFKHAELSATATEVVAGAQSQTGVASSRAIVAAASAYADAQKSEDDEGDAPGGATSGGASSDTATSDGAASGALSYDAGASDADSA